MSTAVLGFVFIILGAVSAFDAFRIINTVRTPGVFDLVGPDRYLLALGVLLAILGAVMARSGIRHMPSGGLSIVRSDQGSRVHIWLFALTAAYVGAILVAGYTVATLPFFFLAFRLLGLGGWRRNVVAAAGLTFLFYLLFIYFADMPLPKGWVADLME